MQIQTDEMRRAIGEATDVVPRRPGLMDAWLCVLDAVVQVLTFGRSGSGAFFAGQFDPGRKSPSALGTAENIFELMFTGGWRIFGINYPDKTG